MECHELQESILDALDRTPSPERQRMIDAHVSTCAACARFAREQRLLDATLAFALAPPAMTPISRPALRARIRRDAVTARRDTLPDVVHFASFGLATLAMTYALPLSPSIVAGGGLTVALLSYVVLSVIRGSFEDHPLEVAPTR